MNEAVFADDDPQDQRRIWNTFSNAIGAELRDAQTIRGQSGLDHQVQAIAVDDAGKRVIVISAEADPRSAAMMQVDLQSTMPAARVLVARPVAFDVSGTVKKIVEPLGLSTIDIAQAKLFMTRLQEANDEETRALLPMPKSEDWISEIVGNASILSLPVMSFVSNAIAQAGNLPWREIHQIFDETINSGTIDLNKLLAGNSLEADLKAGVCPIPFYDFSTEDAEVFLPEPTAMLRGKFYKS